MSISSFDTVNVYARISKTGEAIPKAGDLVGQSLNVHVKNGNPVAITINSIKE